MYGCERWTVKKAEHWRIDAFELWCWRRLLRVPWTARRSNQSIPKEISPGYSLEGLRLKLKTQYFGPLMWRTDAFELWCWRRLLRVPWAVKRFNQSILKEINPGYSLEGLMLEAEIPILWLPDAKNWLIWKDPDAGKNWRWEEKGMTEDEIVEWHHRLNGHEFV